VAEIEVGWVTPQSTVVVAARLPWPALPLRWPAMLGEVWDCLRAAGIHSGCPNVMLYRDAGTVANVEIGS
jgi:hypothetical protein